MTGRSRYAISDIHGCVNTLKALVENELKPALGDSLYILGDFIDRGPDAKGVVDYLFELEKDGIEVCCLRGNHEDLLLKALLKDELFKIWLANGASPTLQSFKVQWPIEIPEKHLNFFRNLPCYLELDDCFLVHGGFNFKAPNPFIDEESMLWIREFEIDDKWTKQKKIIHGHTPTTLHEIFKSLENCNPDLDIDAGAVYKNHYGLGYLCALNLDNMQLHYVKNCD